MAQVFENGKKYNKSIVYTRLGKRIEEELTYDKFIEGLNKYMEFSFYYEDKTIDFAYHYENNHNVWELNINGYEEDAEHQLFASVSDLISAARICGMTIEQIWNDLSN